MFNLLYIALFCIICVTVHSLTSAEVPSFDEYIVTHNKQYSTVEYLAHKSIYERKVSELLSHDDSLGWTVGINKFTDMTDGELKKYTNGIRHFPSQKKGQPIDLKGLDYKMNPNGIDWSAMNATSPVKDQGGCGSCWAFSAVETIESYQYISSGKMNILSPQQLVDCVENPKHCGGTGGCQGSTYEMAFAYVMQSGVTTESEYPYSGKDGKCAASEHDSVGYLSSFNTVSNDKETTIALLNKGPLSIALDATYFSSYRGGIYSGCDDYHPIINHGVQLVGYGSDNGTDYWLVRNSWGPSWGENGYIRIKMQDTPICALDVHPEDGLACDGQTDPVEVCGSCGLLFDVAYVTYIN